MASTLGLCSWSLSPSEASELADRADEIGVTAVQLALGPLLDGGWPVEATVDVLRERGIAIRSGMISFQGEDYTTLDTIRDTGGVRVDDLWDANRDMASAAAELSQDLELSLVTVHAGFIPHEADDPVRATMVARLREVVDLFARRGVRVGFETGQESASTLLEVLQELDHPNVGVNFDPANMILYGMGDPIEALRRLRPYVVQLHIKDAKAATSPGQWGEEVIVGTGEVDWRAFFDVIRETDLNVDLMVEREAGDDRVADMRAAVELVRSFR